MEKLLFKLSVAFNVCFVLLLGLGGFIWADTNGIWHNAEDVKPGVFGDDEEPGQYVFQNNVSIESNLCLDGECYENWQDVCNSWLNSNHIN